MKTNFTFSDLYEQSANNSLDHKASTEKHLCKLTEEFGEFAQGINKMLGIKDSQENPDAIIDNITEEAADMLQIISILCSRYGIGPEKVMEAWFNKNHVYAAWIKEKNKKKF
jgi:NTP pyrophosphatase (non-canonical NTP hydrolase)